MDTDSNASLAIKDRMLRIDTNREEEDQAFALDYEEIELLSADMEERQASEEKPSSLIHSHKNYHLGRGSRPWPWHIRIIHLYPRTQSLG